MRCERIQDLILSDYIDGQVDESNRRLVAEHIEGCSACREFEAAVRAKAVEPFKDARKAEVPVYLWEGIRRKIAAEGRTTGVLTGVAMTLRRGLEGLLRIPKPAVAFAFVAVLIIAIVIAQPYFEKGAIDNYINDQVDFMANLDSDDANGYTALDVNVNTGVENLL